ncbi:hypothetical protein E3P92_03434 [Wallemia ichthyophaga]|uniref:La protein-like protein n=2 Tax=Wallemia ichthyophaga TaxID=245174 RepID=A0A4T0J3T2_WALIC|nr:La protein-like protein [Wallemia ichthyophaga EXF-994]TIA69746.1 hypothetical protein E3P91_03451 [Wallemia ichthyophaga]EOR01833.1 La protein-like protein [Wallemia ichthyophaga EXF-994]TIA79206.1 hypothetical protein E3P98_03440 [Wallemia ichthyophaga]TIA96085.1 hypothetical protein E3P95_03412 [Wallemia ichthyophaga]TIA97149.1 hypothetical protein E3P94_03411 [Wallemia ichthyophaga]
MEDPSQTILNQVEFYFADTNLPFDKFLWSLTKKNDEGWVPISTIASFKRMREPVEKAGGADKVADILRQSSKLAVSEDGGNVKRVTELKPVTDRESRSIYAKGFPDETQSTQLDLENFFAKFGKTLAVRMRRDEKKAFKNSVFVEFESVDDAKKFLELPQEERRYNDSDLLTMAKDAYVEMKCKEKGITPGSGNKKSKGHFNAFKEENKKNKDSEKAAQPLTMTLMGKDIEVNKENGQFDESALQFTPGSVLKWSAPSSLGDMVFRDLKSSMKQHIEPSFVIVDDAKTNGMSGYKRPVEDGDISTLNNNVKVNDVAVSFTRPSQEEEKQYYLENAKNMAQAVLTRHNEAGKKRKGGGQNFGNKKQRRN